MVLVLGCGGNDDDQVLASNVDFKLAVADYNSAFVDYLDAQLADKISARKFVDAEYDLKDSVDEVLEHVGKPGVTASTPMDDEGTTISQWLAAEASEIEDYLPEEARAMDRARESLAE